MIFISYSHHDYEQADKLRLRLEQDGMSCWMAPHSIQAGSDYASVIPSAIGGCHAFLLLLSAHSQESLWVPKELDTAFSYGKPIVPYLLDASPLQPGFAFKLINVQQISSAGKADQGYAELFSALKPYVQGGAVAPAFPPATAAPAPAPAKTKGMPGLAWVLILLVCLALATAGVWAVAGRDASGDPQPSAAPVTELAQITSGHYVIAPSTDGSCTIVDYTDKAVTALAIPPTIEGYRVTAIGKQAFIKCEQLVSLAFPEGLTSIGLAAFNDCGNLADISLPQSLSHIDRYAFLGCYSIDNLVMPDHITMFDGNAFPSTTTLFVKPGSVTEQTLRSASISAYNLPRVAFTTTGEYTDCSTCSQTGSCQNCTGFGIMYIFTEDYIGTELCPDCDGSGNCPECNGFGTI